MKLANPRPLRPGEIKKKGDEYIHEGRWHEIGATLGTAVTEKDQRKFRTRRRLPKFYE